MKVVDNMAIDSHMHINSMVLRDVQEYIETINKSHSIKSVVNVGLNIETSKESVLISEKNSKFYSTIGIHPLYTSSQDVDSLYMLADNDKVIAIGEYGCVFHSFQPDIDDLRYLVRNGYYISFAGRITYKTTKKSIKVAKVVPNDLFLVETDSPYISPEPYRGEINKSSNISFIIKRIAEVKETSYKEIV